MVRVISEDGANNEQESAATMPVPGAIVDDEAARIEKARQACGYIPPAAFKNASLVAACAAKADAAMNNRFEGGPPSSNEIQRRIYIARRAAGYVGNPKPARPIPVPPVSKSYSPSMMLRIEHARKAAGYDGSNHVQKKQKVNVGKASVDSVPMRSPKLITKADMDARMRNAREAAGYTLTALEQPSTAPDPATKPDEMTSKPEESDLAQA